MKNQQRTGHAPGFTDAETAGIFSGSRRLGREVAELQIGGTLYEKTVSGRTQAVSRGSSHCRVWVYNAL